MSMTVTPNAPRFHALWQHTEKRRIFAIRKDDWNSLNIASSIEEKLLKLDLAQIQPLPFGGLLSEVDMIGGTANPTTSRVIIKIYRRDPNDNPTPINVDTYTVWMGLPHYLNVPDMIAKGSTSNDDNFSHYANDHVFLVKERPGDDHWLEELPREVYILLSSE